MIFVRYTIGGHDRVKILRILLYNKTVSILLRYVIFYWQSVPEKTTRNDDLRLTSQII